MISYDGVGAIFVGLLEMPLCSPSPKGMNFCRNSGDLKEGQI